MIPIFRIHKALIFSFFVCCIQISDVNAQVMERTGAYGSLTKEDVARYLYNCKPRQTDNSGIPRFIQCYFNSLISHREPGRCWTIVNKENRYYCKQYHDLKKSARIIVNASAQRLGCIGPLTPRGWMGLEFERAQCVGSRIGNPYWENAKFFRGSRCTADCSGHRAGYEWAKSSNIYREKECANQSKSFTNGCKIYLRTN